MAKAYNEITKKLSKTFAWKVKLNNKINKVKIILTQIFCDSFTF